MKTIIEQPIQQGEIEIKWLENTDGIILMPIYHEVTSAVLPLFKDKPVLLDAQGLTRLTLAKTDTGFYPVVQASWDTINDYAGKISILKLSDDDIKNIFFPGNKKMLKKN